MGDYTLFEGFGGFPMRNHTWEMVSWQPRYANWRWQRVKEFSLVHQDEPLPNSSSEIKRLWALVEQDIYKSCFTPVKTGLIPTETIGAFPSYRIVEPLSGFYDAMKPESLGKIERVLQCCPKTAIFGHSSFDVGFDGDGTLVGYLCWVRWVEDDNLAKDYQESIKQAKQILGDLELVEDWEVELDYAKGQQVEA